MGTGAEKVTVQTVVQLPVEKVWKYWTEPAHITQWNNASDDWHTPFSENDLRVGGSFTSKMAAKDGSFEFEFGGVYDEVRIHEYIAYTLGDGREVSITFISQDNETKVIETFETETMNAVEMQQAGWQAIMDNFKKYAESVND
ncbi:SRPBCC family protein [Paenibacillus sp. CF384]|uniref:SRPBCC family protein n=1 Tax=Paenibacillus sp. CF384 TaxID=1884382 RepID=UPI000896F8F0|nr:SRPBCC family protein [Paenibacillus sp. CF384]SDW72462.1 Uncharacterized conserved protein YndB, AHSA1/START domain [Paenibacillus sp. CF384]